LLEPLAVLEVDVLRNEALLRSHPQTRRADKLCYYECLMNGTGQASLRRHQNTQQLGSRRRQVAFALTHEALAKFAANLADVK
jgi:hypothetical protein